ncbi:MAG: hypothetical protein RL497_1458 [Pseudomonadota bacterium]|jgi:uncharacterized membrane protein YgdD (TMEM256/DUF423 family)
MNTSIKAAAILGGVAVLAGAFGAHGLKSILTAHDLAIWHTAVLYQFFHALALLALSFAAAEQPWRLSFWAWVLGSIIFSGSLYALALGAPSVVGALTPVGGIAFCVGWFNLLRFKNAP